MKTKLSMGIGVSLISRQKTIKVFDYKISKHLFFSSLFNQLLLYDGCIFQTFGKVYHSTVSRSAGVVKVPFSLFIFLFRSTYFQLVLLKVTTVSYSILRKYEITLLNKFLLCVTFVALTHTDRKLTINTRNKECKLQTLRK